MESILEKGPNFVDTFLDPADAMDSSQILSLQRDLSEVVECSDQQLQNVHPSDIAAQPNQRSLSEPDANVSSSHHEILSWDDTILLDDLVALDGSSVPLTTVDQDAANTLAESFMTTNRLPLVSPMTSPTLTVNTQAALKEQQLQPQPLNDMNLAISSHPSHKTSRTLSAPVRRARAHGWPRYSDPPSVMPWPIVFEEKTIGNSGRDSGRNWLACFDGLDGTPRTRYKIRVLRGRDSAYLPSVQHYPACNVGIPGGLTLLEICEKYPRHVWGTGLRMFIAEGWTGENIFEALPEDFRDSKAAQRRWNYIQQGFTREVKRMNEEDGQDITPVRKRKRTASFDGDQETVRDRQRIKHRTSSPATAGLEGNVSSIDHSCDTNRARIEVLQKQKNLLWIIGHTKCDMFRTDAGAGQLNRVQICHNNLCRECGVDPITSSIGELDELTNRLEEVAAMALQQPATGAPKSLNESSDEDSAAQPSGTIKLPSTHGAVTETIPLLQNDQCC